MAKSNDLYSTMAELWESFQVNHTKFSESGNKAAGTRVRKGMQALKIWAQDVRKEVQAKKNAS